MRRLIMWADNLCYDAIFRFGLRMGAMLAQRRLDAFTKVLMRFNAKVVLLMRKGLPQPDIVAVAKEWQRMFPASVRQEIIDADNDTVYAETHGYCPLRGTQNVQACHTVMEFDRCLLETMGGRFIVLRSQAKPGATTCRIAIRRLDKSVENLIPAHRRLHT